MNALHKAELNMQSGIEHQPDANIPIIETVRAFSTTFNNQKASKAQTKPANGGQKSPRTGFAPAKSASKRALRNTTLTIATEKCTIRVTKTSFTNFEVFDFEIKFGDITTLNTVN